jgi:hypothetical protein
MASFKIVDKNKPNALAVVLGKNAQHAIERFRRLSGYQGEVIAVAW